jgi:hypothetical protein
MKTFLGFTSAAQAASGTVSAEGVRLNGVRASCCFALYGEIPMPADFGTVADATNRVSTLRSISLLASKATPAVLAEIQKAIIENADGASYHDFLTLVRVACTADSEKAWSTGKGDTKAVTDNVIKPTKKDVERAVVAFSAKKKAEKENRKRQPQAQSTKPTETPAEVQNAPKRQWEIGMAAMKTASAVGTWNIKPEQMESHRDTLEKFFLLGEALGKNLK